MRRAALLGLLAAGPALAQDRPVMVPTRDVDITYHAEVGGRTIDQRLRFRASDRKMRVDLPAPGTYMIADQASRKMSLISDNERTVVDMTIPPEAMPGQMQGGQRFTRRSNDFVGGLECTAWEGNDIAGQETVSCFTADGVLLWAKHGSRLAVQATKVAYGPLSADLFAVPPNYQHVAPPSRP